MLLVDIRVQLSNSGGGPHPITEGLRKDKKYAWKFRPEENCTGYLTIVYIMPVHNRGVDSGAGSPYKLCRDSR